MKRRGLLGAVLTGAMLLSSCSLLPEEATFSTAPLIREYEREEFKMAFAERGDMLLTQKISCTYVPVQTEALRFKVGGEQFDTVFVQVGDSVKKGQLLAQLNLEGAQEQIDSIGIQIEKLGIQLAAVEENRALAIERQKILMSKSTKKELESALEEINKQYDRQKESIEDEMALAQMQLREAEQKRDERQLRAGIDGTVTFVRSIRSGERSVAGDRMLSVADATNSIFRAETKLWKEFAPGDEYVITVVKDEYEAIVVSEAELGIKETEKQDGEAAFVYLKLKNPAFDLEEGDRGTMVLLLDSREDVLMVPESAVTTADGQSIVYYQNEDGMKAYKPVETGLVANGMVEIISGLTEGESVIVE